MRVAWRTVGGIIGRVAAEAEAGVDRFRGLRRIGIDEISYRKGHRYLTVVVDHDRGRLLWAKAGRDSATLDQFFQLLGPKRCERIEMVSADAAEWIKKVVDKRCPNAKLCLDPFHVVSWATDALDEVRREIWNEARSDGRTDEAKDIKGARFALWKNPGNLTPRQKDTLASIAETNDPLYRAYLLKEHLRLVFKLKGRRGKKLLNQWLQWARRCRIQPFVELARKIHHDHRKAIDHVLETGLSNALVESTNCKIRVLARQAFGFHTPEALVGIAMLALGGLCPDLPGRS
jgi:transposase